MWVLREIEKEEGRTQPMKTKKYCYLFVLQGNCGYGWEDLTQSESYREIRADLRAYRENAPEISYRVINRRERNQ